jgi:hypothetical protein
VTITAITLASAGDFTLNDAACLNPQLSPGASRTLTVTFSPIAAGPRRGSITIVDNTANPDHLVILSGIGQEGL